MKSERKKKINRSHFTGQAYTAVIKHDGGRRLRCLKLRTGSEANGNREEAISGNGSRVG